MSRALAKLRFCFAALVHCSLAVLSIKVSFYIHRKFSKYQVLSELAGCDPCHVKPQSQQFLRLGQNPACRLSRPAASILHGAHAVRTQGRAFTTREWCSFTQVKGRILFRQCIFQLMPTFFHFEEVIREPWNPFIEPAEIFLRSFYRMIIFRPIFNQAIDYIK